MLSLRSAVVVTILGFTPLASFASDIYVSNSGDDSKAGTSTAPLRTIQKAARLATPGTTVHVAPGTYAETITSTNIGTASARIRFVSDTKWGAKIIPVAGSNTMWDVSGGYTDIDGFQIDGTLSNTVRAGIYLHGGNSSVTNSLIHHVAETSGCDNQGGGGLVADQSKGSAYQNYDFTNNVVHHVGGGCGWIQGIYHSSSGNIKNNVVYACSQAINMGHDDHNIFVVNNTLFGNSGYGVYYGGCKEAYNNGCPTSGIKIHNNIIYDNAGGIQGPVTAEDVGNEIVNNVVYGNRINFDLASPSNNSRRGEVNVEPQFVDYIRSGGGNYRLRSTSPAIDRGLATYAPLRDIDGYARQGAGVDIGAYEFLLASLPLPTPAPPKVDSIAPQTAITSHRSGSLVSVRTTVVMTASASDNVAVKNVEFYVNGALRCKVSAAPFQCAWKVPRTRGTTYALQTKAYDAAGNVGNSNVVSVKSK